MLDTETAMKATVEILAMHSIPSVVSSDLAEVIAAAKRNAPAPADSTDAAPAETVAAAASIS